jgi:hypothetical protein
MVLANPTHTAWLAESKKKETTQAVKATPHINEGEGATLAD